MVSIASCRRSLENIQVELVYFARSLARLAVGQRPLKPLIGGNDCMRYNHTEHKRTYIGISSNGRTEAFEAFNWGSNPCIPALEKKKHLQESVRTYRTGFCIVFEPFLCLAVSSSIVILRA